MKAKKKPAASARPLGKPARSKTIAAVVTVEDGSAASQALEALSFDTLATVDRLKAMKRQYLKLVVRDGDDEPGYQACFAARREMQTLRTDGKRLADGWKAPHKERIKAIDQAYAAFVEFLAPIEAHLRQQEDVVTQAAARKEQEKAQRLQERLNGRLVRLREVGSYPRHDDIVGMTDGEFESYFELRAAEKRQKDAEAAALEKQRKAQEKEADRLAKEQAKLDAAQAKLDEEADRVALEKAERRQEEERVRKGPLVKRLAAFAERIRRIEVPVEFKDRTAEIQKILDRAAIEIESLVS